MTNFEFYRAKETELRRKLDWIKNSVVRANSNHSLITQWVQEQAGLLESRIALMGTIIQRENNIYLPRLRIEHTLIEKSILMLSNYVGLILREGIHEKQFSQVIRWFLPTSALPITDFLVDFTTIMNGPGVSIGQPNIPIFYVRDEYLASAYAWIPLFHEMGHIAVRQDRARIIEPLVAIVKQYIEESRASIGPVEPGARDRQEAALHKSEKYWTEGTNDVRLEELFCDCYAVYCCGLAYLYSWLDYGVGFEDTPKFIDLCDEHPPFLARFGACWHITPQELKTSESGERLRELWEDYKRSSSGASNPELDYGTACHDDLIGRLAEKSISLIASFWPDLPIWEGESKKDIRFADKDEPIAVALNALVAILFSQSQKYNSFEERIKKSLWSDNVG